ncbi:hypothetical protein LLB_0411 [Legionella longbeachae D-4968]|nr:hypothetical protein LLB_0411 [Legionella longbeachae D-4968]
MLKPCIQPMNIYKYYLITISTKLEKTLGFCVVKEQIMSYSN